MKEPASLVSDAVNAAVGHNRTRRKRHESKLRVTGLSQSLNDIVTLAKQVHRLCLDDRKQFYPCDERMLHTPVRGSSTGNNVEEHPSLGRGEGWLC